MYARKSWLKRKKTEPVDLQGFTPVFTPGCFLFKEFELNLPG